MHPDREIFRMDRRSDGLSMIPYDPNTLIIQSSGTNDAPRDPLLIPVTYNPAWTRTSSMLLLHICLLSQYHLLRHDCDEHYAAASSAQTLPR